MHGYLYEDANLAQFARRQAALESAARHNRLVRALKRAHRCTPELSYRPSARARSGPGCDQDLG